MGSREQNLNWMHTYRVMWGTGDLKLTLDVAGTREAQSIRRRNLNWMWGTKAQGRGGRRTPPPQSSRKQESTGKVTPKVYL